MRIRERIIALLKQHAEGLDDDAITGQLGLSRRQHANATCRNLERAGLVERRTVNGKIRNFCTATALVASSAASGCFESEQPTLDKPWCWEGNVVRAVTKHLIDEGWTVESIADTASGQSGADIQARRHDEVLIVEVKGYPSKLYERGAKVGQTKRTNPTTQARHWVAEALLTALLRQSDGQAHRVAIAFPEFEVYIRLLRRISGAISKLHLEVFIVQQSGAVVVFQGREAARLAQGKPATA